jgi:Domain of unknown function (DUF4124)
MRRVCLMMIKLMIFAVILAGAGLFFIKGPDGKPLMTIEKLVEDLPDSPSNFLPGEVEIPATPAVTRVYKWKDKDGVWQFSNSPVDEDGAEIIELDGRINTVQAFKPRAPARVEAAQSSATPIPGVMTVSPQEAGNMLDTVKNLQKTIDQRKADMDAVSNVGNN